VCDATLGLDLPADLRPACQRGVGVDRRLVDESCDLDGLVLFGGGLRRHGL
jgi:hypothetical protein